MIWTSGPHALHVRRRCRRSARRRRSATKIASIGPCALAQDFHADRALAGDHVGIVVRDGRTSPASAFCSATAHAHTRRCTSRRAARRLAPRASTAAILIDAASSPASRSSPCSRAAARPARRPARGCRPTPRRRRARARRRQMRHLVVGAAQLEREHRLLILALRAARGCRGARDSIGASSSGDSIATS